MRSYRVACLCTLLLVGAENGAASEAPRGSLPETGLAAHPGTVSVGSAERPALCHARRLLQEPAAGQAGPGTLICLEMLDLDSGERASSDQAELPPVPEPEVLLPLPPPPAGRGSEEKPSAVRSRGGPDALAGPDRGAPRPGASQKSPSVETSSPGTSPGVQGAPLPLEPFEGLYAPPERRLR